MRVGLGGEGKESVGGGGGGGVMFFKSKVVSKAALGEVVGLAGCWLHTCMLTGRRRPRARVGSVSFDSCMVGFWIREDWFGASVVGGIDIDIFASRITGSRGGS